MNVLFPLSALPRAPEHQTNLNHSAQGAAVPRAPDPRRHSAVCCCLLCEQHGTGEQAIRQARGNYSGFLALVAASKPPTDAAAHPTGRSVSRGRLAACQARADEPRR